MTSLNRIGRGAGIDGAARNGHGIAVAACTLALALTGCAAGSSRQQGSTGTGNTGTAAGGGTSTGGGGTAGTTMLPGPTGGTNNSFIDMSSTAMGRLTNLEYSQTVTDVLGEPAGASVTYMFPDDPVEHGFDNNVSLLQVSTTHADRYAAAAEAIATGTFASATRRMLVASCDLTTGAACLNTFITQIGRRLYRRPLTGDEVASYVTLAGTNTSATDPYAPAEIVLEGMLVSPYFLYRVQVGVPDAKRTGLVGLNGFEMSTRLSYLLLGTTPDDALLDKAAGGMLDTPAGVNTIVTAMMADPRVRGGVRRFYSDWLPLTQISGPRADPDRMPHMGDPVLAADLVEETSRFVDDVLWDSGGTVLDLLTARYTFVNANLATVYGLPAPTQTWQKVMFAADSPRAGVLTQGALLAAGTHTDKPSNTRRGELVREQFLCNDIPAPPPGVAANLPPAQPGQSEQQVFAVHTTMASCATCHNLMDPIGWGLSGFDSAGAIRTKDSNGQPISVKGLVNGMTPPDFNGPVELGQKIASSDQYKACFATQLFRYSYGRMETATDAGGITQLQASFDGGGWKFAPGLTALVESDGFRYRSKGDAP